MAASNSSTIQAQITFILDLDSGYIRPDGPTNLDAIALVSLPIFADARKIILVSRTVNNSMQILQKAIFSITTSTMAALSEAPEKIDSFEQVRAVFQSKVTTLNQIRIQALLTNLSEINKDNNWEVLDTNNNSANINSLTESLIKFENSNWPSVIDAVVNIIKCFKQDEESSLKDNTQDICNRIIDQINELVEAMSTENVITSTASNKYSFLESYINSANGEISHCVFYCGDLRRRITAKEPTENIFIPLRSDLLANTSTQKLIELLSEKLVAVAISQNSLINDRRASVKFRRLSGKKDSSLASAPTLFSSSVPVYSPVKNKSASSRPRTNSLSFLPIYSSQKSRIEETPDPVIQHLQQRLAYRTLMSFAKTTHVNGNMRRLFDTNDTIDEKIFSRKIQGLVQDFLNQLTAYSNRRKATPCNEEFNNEIIHAAELLLLEKFLLKEEVKVCFLYGGMSGQSALHEIETGNQLSPEAFAQEVVNAYVNYIKQHLFMEAAKLHQDEKISNEILMEVNEYIESSKNTSRYEI